MESNVTIDKNYMVHVRSLVFNHENYIIDAFNGFISQETTFPFVVTIEEDCSTDNTRAVIRAYMEEYFDIPNAKHFELETANIVMADCKKNPNCTFVVYYFKFNHYRTHHSRDVYNNVWRELCKYEAICEGDDYWIDPLKLQKQVEFLDENEEYTLIRTDINRLCQDNGVIENDFFKNNPKFQDCENKSIILKGLFAAPCTWLYRTKNADFPSLDKANYFTGDLLMYLHLSNSGMIKYCEGVTAVYRIVASSASHSLNRNSYWDFWRKCKNTRMLYAKNQPSLLKIQFLLECCLVQNIYFSRNSLKRLLNVIPGFASDFKYLYRQ